jgi:DNA polymerase (family 10)
MPVHNKDISDIFNEVADLLEIKGENRFRIRAYRDAARTISGLSERAADLVKQNKDLRELPGIGRDLAEKIKTIVKKGSLPLLSDLKKELPSGLSDMMKISGLGPKRIKAIYEEFDIRSMTDLKKAVSRGKIRDLEGFGEKTEENLKESIKRFEGTRERILISEAEEITAPLVEYLKEDKRLKSIEVAGSNRRKKETVRDIDILVTCKKGCKIMDRFTGYEDVKKVISRGEKRSSVILKSGLQVDLRLFAQASYGAAMVYFTGSKAHNVKIRKMAVKKKLKINEYGVFKGKKKKAGKSEPQVYKQIELPFIEPELREDRGEVEAGLKGGLPSLITLGDIRGDLHTHSQLTDGHNTLEEMAEAAVKAGYEYVANTEHSKHVSIAGGIDQKELAKQIKRIDRLNKRLKGIIFLKGIELDILSDGKLDLPDSILKDLDLRVCAVHYKFDLPRKKQTDRIIKAMDNKYFNVLAHPTGRMINKRPPYELDMEKIMKAAKDRGCALEVNSHPQRLDLSDIDCRTAKDMGVKLAISTDAHSTSDISLMKYGIWQARRGWIEPEDVINTGNLTELKKFLKR